MSALQAAATLALDDWCLAAGFVRNLVWDYLHEKPSPTPLNDVDLIYFDRSDCSELADQDMEQQLRRLTNHPWSVKNQARMHHRNSDPPYCSVVDAMSYWPEVETATGARLNDDNQVEVVTPFSLESLFCGELTLNAKRRKPDAFQQRMRAKNWLQIWPELLVRGLD